jgi:hypothetical protein
LRNCSNIPKSWRLRKKNSKPDLSPFTMTERAAFSEEAALFHRKRKIRCGRRAGWGDAPRRDAWEQNLDYIKESRYTE